MDVYRSKLKDDVPGIEGDEIARKRIEAYANSIRPAGFVVKSCDPLHRSRHSPQGCRTTLSFTQSILVSLPRRYIMRVYGRLSRTVHRWVQSLHFHPCFNLCLSQEIEFDASYTDTLSLSLSTSYLFNYPTASFARLPISLTISLSQFKSSVKKGMTVSVDPFTNAFGFR